ncbi:MAG: flagellar motility protein MotE (MotC chaperone) [Planctomycetota bacterium]|jgi:flagellar motility protein MotE (MotC chaperone)
MEELNRDESVRADEELQGWKNMAKLYKDGAAEESALMLKLETPQDAALILRELKESRAGEILLQMGTPEERKKYMDAYRIASAVITPE